MVMIKQFVVVVVAVVVVAAVVSFDSLFLEHNVHIYLCIVRGKA